MFSVHHTLIALLFLSFIVVVPAEPQSQKHISYEIEVHNHSSVIFDRIYMSGSDDTGWGEDRLGSGTLEPRHYLPISTAAGTYDFLIVDADERRCQWMSVKVPDTSELEIDDEWLAKNCKHR